MFWPANQYSPLVGASKKANRFIKVDLPEPDGPIKARKSPSGTVKVMPWSAGILTSPFQYVFTRSTTLITSACAAVFMVSSVRRLSQSRLEEYLRRLYHRLASQRSLQYSHHLQNQWSPLVPPATYLGQRAVTTHRLHHCHYIGWPPVQRIARSTFLLPTL